MSELASAEMHNIRTETYATEQEFESIAAAKTYEQKKNQYLREEKNEEMESTQSSIAAYYKQSSRVLIDAIDNFRQNLPVGEMLYNIPKEMTKGDVKVVTLEIAPQQAVDKLKLELSKREGVPLEEIKAEVIRISDLMVATLNASSGLGVRSLNKSKIVPISNTDPNIWRWEVEAKKEGMQKLYLQVGIVLSINGEDRVRNVLDEPREIVVKVSGARSFSDFLKNNWQFLLQILIIPLIILMWEQFKKYRLNRKKYRDSI